MKRLQELLDRLVEEKTGVGASLLIYEDGREAFFGSAGHMDLAGKEPYRRDAILAMYSMTKPVAAAAAMTLFEKGIITPETPVYELIPEFRDVQVLREDGTLSPPKTPLTIEHLLTMTSGITTPREGMDVMPYFQEQVARHIGKGPISTLDIARIFAHVPLVFEPGAQYMYGLGVEVLGGIIVAATGMEFGEYLDRTIFGPLGMEDTFFAVPEEKKQRVAELYDVNDAGEFIIRPKHTVLYEPLDLSRAERGSGGLYSTLDDYIRFGEMLRKGGEGVLKPETIREMSRNHLTPAQLATFGESANGYGYGWLVRTMMQPKKSAAPEGLGAFGWNGMAGTTLRIDPVRKLTVVFGIQRIPARSDLYHPELLKALYEIWPC